MSVVETPILLRADVDKNAYRGEAMSQLRILKREMTLGGLTTSARTVRYSNGVVIQCRKSFEYETVDIFVPKSLPREESSKRLKPDFFIHPRSGNVFLYEVTEDIKIPAIKHGGYYVSGSTYYELTSYVAYPGVDDDHGTFVIAENKDKVTALWAAPAVENYGNCWWAGTDGNTLSWKGTPSQQFPIGASYSIAGLTTKITDGYTVFGRYLYSNGTKLCEGPVVDVNEPTLTLVVGACYAKDTDNTSWLVCLTVSFVNSVYVLQVWRSEDTGKTWQLLNEFPSLRAAVTAFISHDGRRFVYGGQLYQIDAAVSSVVAGVKIPTSTTGTRTVTGAGGYGSTYEFNEGVGYCWPAMNSDNNLVYTTLEEDAKFESSGSYPVGAPPTKLIPRYRGRPATAITVTEVTKIGTNCVQFLAEVNGSYCTLKWSGGPDKNGLLCFDSEEECASYRAGYNIAATIYPQGISASLSRNEETDPVAAVTVSGPTSATEGAVYSGGGGVGGPYTYTTTQGSISAAGVLTGLSGVCGAIIITATDGCGNTGTLTVKAPSGVWVLVEYFTSSAGQLGCGDGRTPGNCYENVCSGNTGDFYLTVSAVKYITGNLYYCADPVDNSTGEPVIGCSCFGAGVNRVHFWRKSVYEWWCTSTVKGW